MTKTWLKWLSSVSLMGLAACGSPDGAPESKSQLEVFHRQNNSVVAEAREYEKDVPGGKARLVFIDMIHVGPKDYYHRVRDVIAKYVKSDSSAVILEEGVDCGNNGERGEFFAVSDSRRFQESFFPGGSRFSRGRLSGSQIAQAYQSMSEAEAEAIIGTGFVKRLSCAQHVRGEGGDINSMYRMIANQMGLTMQKDISDLYPARAKRVRADIDLSTLPTGQKLIFGAFVSCLSLPGCLENSEFSSWINEPSPAARAAKQVVDDVMGPQRNQVAFGHVSTQLSQGAKTIILPWGANHMNDFYRRAEALGFRRSRSQPVELAACRAIVRNPLLNGTVGKHCR